MDTQAAAPAPATEAMSAQVAEALTTTETTDAEPDYGAAYDKAAGDAPVEAAEPAPEAVEAPAEAEPAPEAVEAPTDVPVALRKHWSALPEDARDAVLTSQREMSRKLSDMGRQVQGIAPIRDVLVEAVKTNPAIANMRPEDVARDVMELAQFSAAFKSKPLETFISLANKHGMTDALRQALGGQPQQAQQTATLQNEIAALKQQLARAADPEFIREQVSAVTMQERVLSDVQAFAATQEHWSEVESFMPKVIPLIREAMPDASGKDVLARAYELALQTYRPELKAKAQAAVEAAAQPDPERTQAALKAKSVNVTARTSGKARELTEEESYAAAYDRAARK
jgi:hypothetical protein